MTEKPVEKPHYLGHRKRLRDKLLAKDTGSIPDYEILELLLFSSQPRKDVRPLAKQLLQKYKNFAQLTSATQDDLSNIPDMTDSAISIIKALRESTLRVLLSEAQEQPILNNWKKLLEYIRSNIGFKDVENLSIIYLNKKFRIIFEDNHEHGTIDQVSMYPREIIKKALSVGATAVVLSHNHPSGDPLPSRADISITKDLIKSCAAVDIEIIDHIIVSYNKHYSFKANGLL